MLEHSSRLKARVVGASVYYPPLVIPSENRALEPFYAGKPNAVPVERFTLTHLYPFQAMCSHIKPS